MRSEQLRFITALLIAGAFLSTPFSAPFKGAAHLTSPFGEFRGNKFHMGIDLVPDNNSDTAIMAISSGRVIRIKNSRAGYGRALYLEDDQGNMIVYAHMSAFSQKINETVLLPEWEKAGVIYSDRSFETSPMTISQGDLIGYLGNAGSGTGAHLHVEIRKNGAICFDPLFMFDDIITDSAPPVFCGLIISNYNGKYYTTLGLYDPVSTRNNRLSVNSINGSQISYSVPQFISYDEYSEGGRVYDTTRSSYSCYYYRFEGAPPTGKTNFSVSDLSGNTSVFTVSIPELKKLEQAEYSSNTEVITKLLMTCDRIPRSKIKANPQNMCIKEIKKINGGVKFSVGPGFLGSDAVIDLRIRLRKKEGLYRFTRSGRPLFLTREQTSSLSPGSYGIIRDTEPPIITESDGVFISDVLSGIALTDLEMTLGGIVLILERDFDVLPSGEIIVFRDKREDSDSKALLRVSDRMGNSAETSVPYCEINSRTNPF